jgi:hypothetical protein
VFLVKFIQDFDVSLPDKITRLWLNRSLSLLWFLRIRFNADRGPLALAEALDEARPDIFIER